MPRAKARAQSKLITQILISQDESQLRHEKIVAEKKAYAESKEGQMEAKARALAQECSNEEELAYLRVAKAISKLREETFELIKTTLEEEGENIRTLPAEKLEEVLKFVRTALRKLDAACSTEQYKAHLKQGYYNDHERLFNDLVEKVNIRFLLFAPAHCLKRRSVRWERFPKDCRDEMFARFEKLGLIQDAEFRARVEEQFGEQINSLLDL